MCGTDVRTIDPACGLGDPTHDDSHAINEAIQNAQQIIAGSGYTKGAKVTLAKGLYYIKNTLQISNSFGLRLIGEGMGPTSIRWNGPTASPMVQLKNGQHCSIEDLQLEPSMDPAFTNRAAVEGYRVNDAGAAGTGSYHALRNVWIGGGGKYFCDKGIRLWADSDANQDFWLFDRVKVEKTITANWSFEHSQSYSHTLQHCLGTGGLYGVATALVPQGGSFRWYGGGLGAHSTADFFLAASGDPQIIEGCNCEDSDRFLILYQGISNSMSNIIVRGARFAGNGMNADGRWIWLNGPGPVSITGCSYGAGAAKAPRVLVNNGTVNPISLRFDDNTCGFHGSADVDPVEFLGAHYPYFISRQGNMATRADGLAVPMTVSGITSQP